MKLADENKKYLLTGNEACAEAAIQLVADFIMDTQLRRKMKF